LGSTRGPLHVPKFYELLVHKRPKIEPSFITTPRKRLILCLFLPSLAEVTKRKSTKLCQTVKGLIGCRKCCKIWGFSLKMFGAKVSKFFGSSAQFDCSKGNLASTVVGVPGSQKDFKLEMASRRAALSVNTSLICHLFYSYTIVSPSY